MYIMLNEVFHERFWPAMGFPIEDLEEKLAISKQNLRMMIHAINNKPDEITCEELTHFYDVIHDAQVVLNLPKPLKKNP